MEGLYYHALATALHGEYRTLKKQKDAYGTWASAWHAYASIHKSGASPEKLWDALSQSGIQIILNDDALFPFLLKEIPWPPFGFYMKGVLPPKDIPTVAIVGTRNATPSGKSLARNVAQSLASRGVAIVSGLALGIDAEAHMGALEGKGHTVAVLAGGVDDFTPRTNAPLATRILASGGAILSEYPPGTPPLPHRFIERNRIVSGLAKAIFIVEAPEGSGSLATARFALDQNRDVLVAPGTAIHPNYAGSHALIRNGATLATEAAHVLEALGIDVRSTAAPLGLSLEETRMYEVLVSSAHPLPIDKIIELTNLKPNDANQAISFLMIKHHIKETGNGYSIV